MGEYFGDFCKLMGVKSHPNDYEKSLFEKTQKYCRYISWIPGLKMVAVCNSLSMYATKILHPCMPVGKSDSSPRVEKRNYTEATSKNSPLHSMERGQGGGGSDIDLFIITAPKRIWFIRVAITLIFQLLGVRRHGNKVKDRFCLSFFITENAMDFSSFAIENDIYLFYWIYYLKPIINKDNTYERFIKANKLLGIDEINLHGDNKVYLMKSGKYLKFLDKCKILDFKNWTLKKIFLPKTLTHKKRLGDPAGIIVSDDILKFHNNDRRKEVRDRILRS